jgi:hypothetical protein
LQGFSGGLDAGWYLKHVSTILSFYFPMRI